MCLQRGTFAASGFPSRGRVQDGGAWRGTSPGDTDDQKEHTLANQSASLGKISPGGGAAAPTIMDAPKQLHSVSAATIERLTGVKLPSEASNSRGLHGRS